MRWESKPSACRKVASRLWALLPAGGSLPDEVWRGRHRFLVGLTWFHAVVIALLGPLLGRTWELSFAALAHEDAVVHAIWEGALVGMFAFLAGALKTKRAFRAALVGFGLISSSAILVHLLGGYIELHFHFFVMLTFLALYQDWTPFGLAIIYVAVHHGIVGVLWPTEVYNHPAAVNAPWTWAGIHAFFVLWASAGSLIAWRLNEAAIARNKLILDSAGEGIYGLDTNGKTTFLNPAAAKMLGYQTHELTGRSMHDVLHYAKANGEAYPREECPIYAAFKDGAIHQVREEVFWRKDGTSFPVDYVSTPIIDRGDLRGAVVTFRDVSHRAKWVQALLESELQFRQIAENLKQVFWITDPVANAWLYVSPAYREIWGRSADALGPIAESWLGAIHPEDLERVLAAVARQAAGGYDEEYRIIRPDGSVRWIRDRAFPVRNDAGKNYRVAGFAEDVTERKLAAGELARRAKEQEALNVIANAVSHSLHREELLEIALEKVLEVTGRERGTIRLKDPDTGAIKLSAHRGFSPAEIAELQRNVPHRISEKIFASGAPIVINDDVAQSERQTLLPDSRSVAWVPLKARQKVVGVLGVSAGRPIPFPEREVELLTAVGNVIGMAVENAWLFEETERNLERTRALREIDQAITTSLDLGTVLDVLMEKIDIVLPYSAATVRLFNPENRLLEPVACRNLDASEWKESPWRGGRGIANVVFETRAPLIIRNAQADARVRDPAFYRKHKLTSYVGVPLRVKDRVLGVLGFYTKEEHDFTGEEVEFLMTLSGQAAIAIHNSQLYEEARLRETELQETNRMLSALHAVAAAASRSPDFDRIVRAAIEKITDLFVFDATQIHVRDEHTDELALGAYFEKNANFASVKSFRVGQGIVGKVAESGKPLIFEDVASDPLYQRLSRTKTSGQFGYRFFAVFPIQGKLKILGTLACTGRDPRRLSSGEIQLLEAITDQIAVAIENNELYEQLKQKVSELELKTEELERAHKVKDEFLSVISHELRTPLNVVMGYTAMIKDEILGQVNPEQSQVLEKLMLRVRSQYAAGDSDPGEYRPRRERNRQPECSARRAQVRLRG